MFTLALVPRAASGEGVNIPGVQDEALTKAVNSLSDPGLDA